MQYNIVLRFYLCNILNKVTILQNSSLIHESWSTKIRFIQLILHLKFDNYPYFLNIIFNVIEKPGLRKNKPC